MPKLFDLQYGRKFSMMDDDVIAMADSYDGYASWQIRIANYGLLIEQVEFRQCDGKPFEEFNVELPDGYVESLQQKAMSVGFASFPDHFETKIDIYMALSYTLVIRTGGELKRGGVPGVTERELTKPLPAGERFVF